MADCRRNGNACLVMHQATERRGRGCFGGLWGGYGGGDGVVVAGGRGWAGRRGRMGSRGLLRQKQLAADLR
jgi:hypothetical protein